MSTDYMIKTSDTAAGASLTPEVTQADTIRSKMSVDNLVESSSDSPDITSALILAPPSTPKSTKEEPSSPTVKTPDTVMTDLAEPDASGDESLDDGEDVPDSQREFLCMNDEHTRCMTGQYTKDLSRKVISDHFGRNKACTRDVTDWPLFCRKHYQRATYNKTKWQIRKVQLILRQFEVIEKQFPGTTYDIAFKKSEEARLNHYSRQVAAGAKNDQAEKSVHPKIGKHFEAPIDVLRELDQWLGFNKTYAEVKKIVDVILQMLEEKETEQVPSIEFLPKLPGKTPSPKKTPAKARTPKSPKSPKSPAKSPKTPTRVSNKGSVKKTSAKA
ncbi:uncharacterized protein J4E88_007003 [Alternaria novae-zelandiae]|uniref:uncharacterized protein n=1 Tax=Alternaria novae-zelandiae TaxID=430562 RepID=UPI0020C3F146|nr:uncharacterized protein J4E88_007003 [Alternaria novae-zelandiae]KAI4677195.1 hypothetical protein J4E88_007003 [Alternaria novae-zelandiae]